MNRERTGAGGEIGFARRGFEELVEFSRVTMRDGEPLIRNPVHRRQLAKRAIEIEAMRNLCYRVAWLIDKGENDMTSAYASTLKVFGMESCQRLSWTGSDIMGIYGQVKKASPWAPLNGKYESSYQTSVGMNIAGGTSEVQRNIIAWTALNLPRKS
jgi:alkylation response protein AidB-like acyl-CoA dehydrogenase